MVTHVRRTTPRPLYLKEWREHFGLSAEQMAGRLGIERESVYRLEREQKRINTEKQISYADALGIEPEDLWRLPTKPSLDAMVRGKSDEVIGMAADIVRRLVGKAS